MSRDKKVEDYALNDIEDLILRKATHCWNNTINKIDIDEWLKNFSGEIFHVGIEQKLALMLLSNFVYITHEEVLHLCRVIYYEYIHELAVSGVNVQEALDNTYFYPIGNPSESSSLVMYFFRIANEIPKDKFRYRAPIASENHRVVYIDDISGSGTQAYEEFVYSETFSSSNKSAMNYLCLISSLEAETKIGSLGVKVISGTQMDSRMKLFSHNSYTDYSPSVSSQMIALLTHYSEKVNWAPLGYKNSEIAFGFYYNVPDNTLPIFWRDSKDWTPIFKRFHKKYSSNSGGESFNDRDKFI